MDRCQTAGMAARGALSGPSGTVLVAAAGLLCVSVATSLLRVSSPVPPPIAEGLFWIGLLLVVLPGALRLLSRGPSRSERIGLVLLIGMGLYIVKVLRDPIAFTRHDELLHWRTATDIISSGRLFDANPLLVVSPPYPGLESNVAAVSQLGGADVFLSGLLVIGLARAILIVALFLVFEEGFSSAWLAGIGVAIYMMNPSFLFFSSTFVYESLAIALSVVLILVTLRRQRASRPTLARYTIAAATLCVVLVLTHHVTTLVTIGILSVMAISSRILGRDPVAARRAAEVAAFLAAAFLIWLIVAAQATLAYLGPPVIDTIRQFIGLLMGEDVTRPLFTAETGLVAPLWERIAAIAATAITLAGIAIGVVLAWRRMRSSAFALALSSIAVAYPVILVVRSTRAGGELAARSSAFAFIGVAFVLALAVAWIITSDLVRWRIEPRHALLTGAAAVLLVGGVVIGTPTWQRLPGPYLVEADSRSFNEQSLETASWALQHLGPDREFAGDRLNRLLMGSYGHQRVVFAHGAGTASWAVFVTDSIGPTEVNVLRRGGVEYVVVDRRLATGLPYVGYYFEKAERLRRAADEPMRASQLDNFDEAPGASRIYDSGDVQVYDVSDLVR
jgi:hypothetical protein